MEHDLPRRWVRKRDGMKAIVVTIGGGSHNWVDIKLASGRIVTVSESGLRRKYDPVPEDDQT